MEYIIKIKKKQKYIFNDAWVWKMAWLDGKQNLPRLMLFLASIVVGIASIVAIDSFNENLHHDIDIQAKDLLGADLVIRANGPFDSLFNKKIDTLGQAQAMDIRFASMVLFMNVHGGTRLIQVVAKQGDYPFYGVVKALPVNVLQSIYEGKFAVIDENLAVQYEVSSGDSLKLGNTVFEVTGIVQSMPGSNAVSTSFTPSVYIAEQHLESTGLIQYGSRYSYRKYFKLAENEDVEVIEASLKPDLKKYDYRLDTVEEQKDNVGDAFTNLYRFFNLLAFVALILGCIGVASSIHIYVQQKKHTIAVLRCMGASGWQSFNIFFIQSTFMGIIGSLLGVMAGVAIQYVIPMIFAAVLPVEVTFGLVGTSMLKGLVLGIVVSMLFSVMPLTLVRNIAPLIVIRSFFEEIAARSKSRIVSIFLVVMFPWIFAVYQTSSFTYGSFFMAGLLLAFVCLFGVARAIIWLMRTYMPDGLNFVWKQGLSNLFRPNNQTTVLVIVIGLGAFLLATLGQIQQALLGQVAFMAGSDRPNTVLFDIQPSQKEGVLALTGKHDLPELQMVPIVTTRLKSLNDRTVFELQKDTSVHIRSWALKREYRVTYRDSLIDSETLVAGELRNRKGPNDTIFVSISENMAETLELELGDKVEFDVQGVPITTYIGSLRDVDWQRIQTNFIFVFPSNVLEQAPQFYVLMTRTPDKVTASVFQQELVQFFPNVSAIDLTLILQTIDEFMDKIAFVIRFMAFFSVVTGLIVLIGAISNSRFSRLKENVLFRTLGAVRKQIVRLTLIEYCYLGFIAGLTGSLLSIVSAWGLSRFFFEIDFTPAFGNIVTVCLGITLITVIIGWINTRSVYGDTPIDILRREGG
jgi:putative ABC transport system permease protein